MARILVVDDDEGVRDLLGVVLKRQGHIVDEAMDGRVAFLLHITRRPDLVISDMQMPNLDGLTLARMIEAHGEKHLLPFIPFILTSANAKPADWNGPFFQKPFNIANLVTLISKLLGSRSSTPPRASTPPPSASAPA